MSGLDEALNNLEARKEGINELQEVLEEIKDNEEVVNNLDYDFNQENVDWNFFADLSPSSREEVVPLLKEIMEAESAKELDHIRELSKKIAEVLRNDA